MESRRTAMPACYHHGAQCAIWAGLRKLRDPWFLANEDDRGSFRGLANLDTVKIIREILQDPGTGVHLKITALEAIANSTEYGLNAIIRKMALDKNENTWIRSTALKALTRSVQSEKAMLESIDYELALATDDAAALELRVDLLRQTQAWGRLPARVLSILREAASAKEQRVFGRFYSLSRFLSDGDLNEILDGASQVLTNESRDAFDQWALFEELFKRRLENPTPITPAQLANWLQALSIGRDRHPEKILTPLKSRFEKDPSLFKSVFELLADGMVIPVRSFSFFLGVQLWKLLPATVWPVSQCEFFLNCAEQDNNPERGADFFGMYLAWFPSESASSELAEAGFQFLSRRPDVAKVLGNWNVCKIEKWRKDQYKRRKKDSRKLAANRAYNISYLTPRLTIIRSGGDETALAWAARIYLGVLYDNENVSDATERLVTLTNEEIAEALVEGFIRYVEHRSIPTLQAVVDSWRIRKIPYTHFLLCLSVYLRLNGGMSVPKEALSACIAAVVTVPSIGDSIPGWNDKLSGWLIDQAAQNPSVVRSVLRQLWVTSATIRNGVLPGFHELSQDANSHEFLASVAAEVLKTEITEDLHISRELVSLLLLHDRRAAMEIGEKELTRNDISAEVQAIWNTALFMIDPDKYLNRWRTLISGSDAALWQVIEVIAHRTKGVVSLTSAQRAEIVTIIGQRFANTRHPIGRSDGSRNPWDAAEFVTNQIKLLAANDSPDADAHLERLENDSGLASYRDLIRHLRAQHQKRQRESSFTFASADRSQRLLQIVLLPLQVTFWPL